MPRPPAPEVKPVRQGGPSLTLIVGVVILLVALIGGLVLWAVTRESSLQAGGSSNVLPEGGGVSVGAAGADTPEVQVYEDFQCPWCGLLEGSIGEELAARAERGELTVTYTMMSFLDGKLGNDSSHRATNAALCADDQGAFLTFHGAVFAGQPAQEGEGWTDDQLIGFAEEAGVEDPEAFASCLAEDTYGNYVEAMQERANRDGVTGTPRLMVNGEQVTDAEMNSLLEDPSTLDAVLEAHS